jgi:hypothetical protein
MANRVACNPTEVPVVIDEQGHAIAGLARREVDPDSDIVKQALETGQLVWAETETKKKGES